MASVRLYPPVVNDTEPAFVVYSASSQPEIDNRGTLRINFNLSAFTSLDLNEGQQPEDVLTVHAKITNSKNSKVINSIDGEQGDGTLDNTFRLRAANIILNLKLQKDLNTGLYYIDIKSQDVVSKFGEYQNWIPGWVYKVQIRLSSLKCEGTPSSRGQEAWLFQNQDSFSEWSSVIYAKAISEMKVSLTGFEDYRGGDPKDPAAWAGDIFPNYITGTIQSGTADGPKEYYKSCRIKMQYKEGKDLIDFEDSGDIFATEQSKEQFEYYLKRRLRKIKTTYCLNLSYITLNDYKGSIDYVFEYTQSDKTLSKLDVYTAEYENEFNTNTSYKTPTLKGDNNQDLIFYHKHDFDSKFSVGKDEEEGRISFKIRYNGNGEDFINYSTPTGGIYYCIKRASAEDGFQQWYPIYYGYLPPISSSSLIDYDEYKDVKFDYTAESGVYYKYALEELNSTGGILKVNYPSTDERYVLRVYNHSYLLGENNKQLKVIFDPSISSYSYGVEDAKITTIGGKYPYIARNTAVYYRTFPIASTIASQSDEEQIFFNKEEYYDKVDWDSETGEKFKIAENYTKYAHDHGIVNRDFILERDFRKEVLKFLYDGKPKLFKSSTEGNIIVRLTDISTSPNQSLSRLISSFSANANEIDECNMQTCLQYGFYNPGTVQDIKIERQEN